MRNVGNESTVRFIITLFNVGTVLLCVMLVMKVQYDLLLPYLMLVLSYCA